MNVLIIILGAPVNFIVKPEQVVKILSRFCPCITDSSKCAATPSSEFLPFLYMLCLYYRSVNIKSGALGVSIEDV